MKKLKYILAAVALSMGLAGCMDLQDSYDYKPANIDNHIYMSAMEFIESRQDIFSQLKRAIVHSEIDQAIYTQTARNYTYLLLTNSAFAGASGILSSHGAANVEAMDKATLRNILLYHTVQGYYHGLGTLSFDAVNVITLWDSPQAIMTLKLNNRVSIEQYSRLVVNDMAGTSAPVTATVSNILATNGAIHVLDKEAIYKP